MKKGISGRQIYHLKNKKYFSLGDVLFCMTVEAGILWILQAIVR